MKKFFIVAFLFSNITWASDPYPKNLSIDVEHYRFQIEVTDKSDRISGEATITFKIKKPVSELELDLINKQAVGVGMEILRVMRHGEDLVFSHQQNRVKISLPTQVQEGETLTIQVYYQGVPQDGLIIGKNKFGDRGYFGDNWPDRGRHWLPVIDHPSDKASVEFIVIAPSHYSVVSNGVKVEESPLDGERTLTHWREDTPIPVKVMVIGIARFAVQQSGVVATIPVESWVYPQNRIEGFNDYRFAPKVLDYFCNHIGPYPFKKLANVQSKTRWGGLENAGAIFYTESSVNGKGNHESLIAHEIAHQWFGNSATENDWHHVWLSEGFATYFANLYLENAYGRNKLIEEQVSDRKQIIEYYKKNQAPIVDTTLTDINKVLSINTYQKAGWVLHMLRNKIGDSTFWSGIRKYYTTFQYRNALTSDFINIMESVSGQDLKKFFSQWLYQGGHPQIMINWRFNPQKKQTEFTILQHQKSGLFEFPLEILMVDKSGKKEINTIKISLKEQKAVFSAPEEPVEIVLDPETRLLFEATIQKK